MREIKFRGVDIYTVNDSHLNKYMDDKYRVTGAVFFEGDKVFIIKKTFRPTLNYYDEDTNKDHYEYVGPMDDYYTNHLKENIVEVHPESLGQYTGLKDKNGKDIYEGDVVTGCYDICGNGDSCAGRVISQGFIGMGACLCTGVVNFDEICDSDGYMAMSTMGWVSSNGSSLLDLVNLNICTILGNRYENPDLLTPC